MANSFNIGDKVRFLNDVGGGRVARIEGRLIFVTDADGFEIPVNPSEIVLVSDADDNTVRKGYKEPQRKGEKEGRDKKPLPEGSSWREKVKADAEDVEDEDDIDDEPVLPVKNDGLESVSAYTYKADAADDNNPHLARAFTREDGGATANVELHIVNDTNYFVHYDLLRLSDKGLSELVYASTIEPNTKEKLLTLNPLTLDGANWKFQALLFKRGRSFVAQQPVEKEFHLRGAKILKDTSYVSTDFFDEKAILMHVLKDELTEKVEALSSADLHKAAEQGRREPAKKAKVVNDISKPLEIDLHIEQLVDNLNGLENKDMLKIQMDCVRTTLEKNSGRHGLRIIFIHGVGQGVLKNEIRKLLDSKFPKCKYQDASFQEYGFGATQVTVL